MNTRKNLFAEAQLKLDEMKIALSKMGWLSVKTIKLLVVNTRLPFINILLPVVFGLV